MSFKRKALLIGYDGSDYSSDKLTGVPIDLLSYKKFLLSNKGGAWYENEIVTILNPSLELLRQEVQKIKLEKTDLVFCVFSGHGDYSRENDCRRIQINKDEVIFETELWHISNKQILIIDSCSALAEEPLFESTESYSAFLSYDFALKNLYRSKYEQQCSLCSRQELFFYASSKGEYANDTDKGGEYSYNLISVLKNCKYDRSIVDVHNTARDLVIKSTKGDQTPEKRVPKILKYLPGAIVL